MSSSARRGLLFIVSAPSGTGKTTLVERLVQSVPNLCLSRSYTSRAARSGEQDGVDYNFISRAQFDAMVQSSQFLEWANVFGNCYGTGAAETEACLARGQDLVLVIDVQGARQVRRQIPSVGIFVLPPSAAVLEQRLRGRCQDAEDVIRKRLETARREVAEVATYEYVVVNDDLDLAVDRLRAIVLAERARIDVMGVRARDIIETFG